MASIEAREYGPESTPEEIECIRSRVTTVEGMVLLTQIPRPNGFSLGVVREPILAAAADEEFILIIDVSGSHRPSAEYRESIRDWLDSFDKLVHVHVVTGDNMMAGVGARFVMEGMKPTLEVFESVDDVVRRVRGEAD